jgi:FdhD protein
MSGDKTTAAPQLLPDSPLFGLGYAKPVLRRSYTRISDGIAASEEGEVAEESPVALVYNGRPHAVMMATPADLEDFAVGFTLCEQIVRSVDEISGIDVVRHAQGVELQLEITEAAAARLASRPRNLVGRTSCGLCGVELISDALRDIAPLAGGVHIGVEALARAESALPARQEWNMETGAMHAAAFATAAGELAVVREDVGRHNALDKVIGSLGRSRGNTKEGFIVITSRASYELVQKAAVAGIPLIAAVSRPTGLAIRLAEVTGVALVGLLRNGTANVYADPNKVLKLDSGSGAAVQAAVR